MYEPDLFAPEEAADLFAFLRNEILWRQETVRGRPLPRLNAWFADADLKYSYSGLSHLGTGWPDRLVPIKDRVESAAGADFNSVLLNRYRDGRDSIGFHTDAEPELGKDPVVATLSFGAEREFVLKHRKTGKPMSYWLRHGSLLVMGGSSQHHWLHGVLKTDEPVGERVSLTFRLIIGD